MNDVIISPEEAKEFSNEDLLDRIYKEAKMLVNCRSYGLDRNKSVFLNNLDLLIIERHARALNSKFDINEEAKEKIEKMRKELF